MTSTQRKTMTKHGSAICAGYYALISGGLIALGAMILISPGANAGPKDPKPVIPESTIKSQCEDPDLKGTYATTMIGSNRHSDCQYTDGDGQFCNDSYVNGVFEGTVCANQNPTKPGLLPPKVEDPGLAPQAPLPGTPRCGAP